MSFLGENVKVHFAGAEDIFPIPLDAADIQYRLFSVYKYIKNKKITDDLTLPEDSAMVRQFRNCKHIIQDSGLFTLMFGAGKGRDIDHDFLVDWQDKLIKFTKQNNLDCTCVEIDCQKLLGVNEAWWFRERMKDLLPNRQINVFHYEDGKEGFDRLIDFSEYIAISVPELRIVKPRTYKHYAISLAKYAKLRKPSIDIHMLGCTEYAMLPEITFCTSADSTSWLSGVRYGYFNDGRIKGHVDKQMKKKVIEERAKRIEQLAKESGFDFRERQIRYYTNASLCATIAKDRYSILAGDQN